MTAKRRTTLVLAVLLAVALGWEVLALGSSETQAWTFSRLLWDLSGNPLVGFVGGFFAGHFFFPKGSCLHCGMRPYRRDPMSEAAFDWRLRIFARRWGVLVAKEQHVEVPMDGAKREAGFPVFTVMP